MLPKELPSESDTAPARGEQDPAQASNADQGKDLPPQSPPTASPASTPSGEGDPYRTDMALIDRICKDNPGLTPEEAIEMVEAAGG